MNKAASSTVPSYFISTGHAKEALELARMQEQSVQLEHQSKVKVGVAVGIHSSGVNLWSSVAVLRRRNCWALVSANITQTKLTNRNMRRLWSRWRASRSNCRGRRGGKHWERRQSKTKQYGINTAILTARHLKVIHILHVNVMNWFLTSRGHIIKTNLPDRGTMISSGNR